MFKKIVSTCLLALKSIRHLCVTLFVMAGLCQSHAATFSWAQGVDDFNHGYYAVSIAQDDGRGIYLLHVDSGVGQQLANGLHVIAIGIRQDSVVGIASRRNPDRHQTFEIDTASGQLTWGADVNNVASYAQGVTAYDEANNLMYLGQSRCGSSWCAQRIDLETGGRSNVLTNGPVIYLDNGTLKSTDYPLTDASRWGCPQGVFAPDPANNRAWFMCLEFERQSGSYLQHVIAEQNLTTKAENVVGLGQNFPISSLGFDKARAMLVFATHGALPASQAQNTARSAFNRQFAGLSGRKIVRFGTRKNDRLVSNDPIFYVAARGDDIIKSRSSRRSIVYGGPGKDIIRLGAGNDIFVGGRGGDRLTGGGGKNKYVYESTADSKPADRDVISDFSPANDKINLRLIDANSRKANRQKLRYIGNAPFTGRAGELRWRVLPSGLATMIEADTNGSGKATFKIQLKGIKNLSRANFYL